MKELIVYEFEGAKFTPRPGLKEGEIVFDPDEVAQAIGASSGRQIARMVDDDEKGVHYVDTLGGRQERTYITEPGLYTVLIRSRSKLAKPFRRYVTHEVLPAIRKHGFYVDERRADEVPPEVLAAWRRAYGGEPNGGLRVMFDGDLIHEVKGTPIDTVERAVEAIDRAFAQYGTVCQLRRAS